MPSGLVQAIDVSSHQPTDLTALIRQTEARHVVVKLYLPEEQISQDHSRAQAESARANGCSVAGYVWGYADLHPIKTIDNAVQLAYQCGIDVARVPLWLDLETYNGKPGPSPYWISKAETRCRQFGARLGIYTGDWYWRDYMGNTDVFAHLPLWLAQHDGIPDVEQVTLFGGWAQAVGKQYAADGIDRNVFRREYV